MLFRSPNTLVMIKNKTLNYNYTGLVDSVKYIKNINGEHTILGVVDKNTYNPDGNAGNITGPFN